MAMARDNRPRNPEHIRQIQRLYDPEILQKDMRFYDHEISARSIDDHLDTTDDFRLWARQKMKGTNLDPENRRAVQISDSPMSNYDIEFTRLNRTDSITPSSLSYLSIPTGSSTSLTLHNTSTPTISRRTNRISNPARRSGNCTPSAILRQKQSANIRADQNISAGKQLKRHRKSLQNFQPMTFSTPVRTDRKKTSIFDRTPAQPESEPVVSTSCENIGAQTPEAQNNDENNPINGSQAPISINESDRTLTDENGGNASVSKTVIPETQNNDTIVPETQEDQIPETQDEVYIPATQEDDLPTTQGDAATDPVQAQDPNQQAEPQECVVGRSAPNRILARPPIWNLSKTATPTKHVPLNATTAKQTPSTPSRIPITIPGTPKIGKTLVSRLETSKVTEKPLRPNVTEVSSSNAPNAPNAPNASIAETGRTIVVVTTPSEKSAPSSQPQPQAQPSVMPSNMTINVNVNGSIPQSPKQTSPNQNGNNKSTTNATKTTKPNKRNGDNRYSSSSDSLMTNDSDSDGTRTNSSSQCDTPVCHFRKPGDNASNGSARRELFPNRRSAQFNKIDNLTRTILNGNSVASPTNIPNRSNGNNLIVTPRSQTFVKSKTSLPNNATYDVLKDSASSRSQCHQNFVGIDTEEFLSDIALPNDTANGESIEGSRFSLADIPSVARLESMHVTAEDIAVNGTNIQSINKSKNMQRNSMIFNPKSPRYNPTLILERIDVRSHELRKNSMVNPFISHSAHLFRNVRENTLSNIVTPPLRFKDSIVNENGRLDVTSPTTGERELRKSILSSKKTGSKSKEDKSKRKQKIDKDLAIVQQNLENKKKKPLSDKPRGRRLYTNDAFADYDDDGGESAHSRSSESSNQSVCTVFKAPIGIPPRKSNAKSITASMGGAATESVQPQNEILMSINIERLSVVELECNVPEQIECDEHEALDQSELYNDSTEQKIQHNTRTSTSKSKKSKGKAKVSETTDDEGMHTEADSDDNRNIDKDLVTSTSNLRKSNRAQRKIRELESTDEENDNQNTDANRHISKESVSSTSNTRKSKRTNKKTEGSENTYDDNEDDGVNRQSSRSPVPSNPNTRVSNRLQKRTRELDNTDDDKEDKDDNADDNQNATKKSTPSTSSGKKSKTIQSKKSANPRKKASTKEADVENVDANSNLNSSTELLSCESTDIRRSSRKRLTDNGQRFDRIAYLTNSTIYDRKKGPRLISSEARSEPVVRARSVEREPPKKRVRSQSATSEKRLRQSSTSSRSAMKAKPHRPTTTENDHAEGIDSFLEIHCEKWQVSLEWWKNIVDFSQKNKIINSPDEVDLEYIHNTKDGRIEVTHTSKIDFFEKDGVDYGYVPTSKKKCFGFMRFQPGAAKSKVKSASNVELLVLNGEFILQKEDGDIEIFASTTTIVPMGAVYGLVNRSDYIGIIQFTYAS